MIIEKQSIETAVANADLPLATAHHHNNFTFLRFLFASLVLVSHAPEIVDGNFSRELLTRAFGSISFGALAVQGFFLLSGYLIVKSWQRTPNLADYFQKRVRRIYPGFLVAFLLSVFVFAPIAAPAVSGYFSALNYPLVLANILQLRPPEVPPILVGLPYQGINNAMWSIAYEFRCYALVALIGFVAGSRQKHIWLILFLVSIVLGFLPEQVRKFDLPGLYRLMGEPNEFVRVFTFFAAGACFYFFRKLLLPRGKWAAAAMLLLVIGMFFVPRFTQVGLATLGTYSLFWFAFAKIPALRPFQRMDDISYGIYLYGWPTQSLLAWAFPHVSPWLLLPVALVICCIAGYASWHLVESKFISSGKKMAK